MNQRLRARGHKLWCTWRATATYHPQSTIRGLARYAFQNGLWNVASLSRNRAAMGLRHFVPLIFVISLLGLFVVALIGTLAGYRRFALPFAGLIALHALAGVLAALQTARRERSLLPLLMPFVFFVFHFSYGFGSFMGLMGGVTAERLASANRQK